MQQLKSLLTRCGVTQADLARTVDLSRAAIAQLINHDQWPKTLDREVLRGQIVDFLYDHGANDADIVALEAVEAPRANAEPPATPENSNETEECEPMLMPKQTLMPAAKRAFGLMRDPFGDLQSADDMYVSPDIRYIRESLYHTARHDGFLAVIGESGAGKSTLRRDLVHRLEAESAPVIVIEPYVLGMEDNDAKGKTLKATHIAESIMNAVAPLQKTKSSPEGRFAQVHDTLKASRAAGFRHVLIIEEAHSIPVPTLKHLKRMRDQLEVGFDKLLSIILIGQPELAVKLSPRNGEVREVAQRIEIAELLPVPVADLEQHLAFRFARAGKQLAEIFDATGVQAIVERLGKSGRDQTSQLYPLAIGNLVAGLNLAAQVGEARITADVVKGV
jgi:type II secretory pathway predicted ATPase ExeA